MHTTICYYPIDIPFISRSGSDHTSLPLPPVTCFE